MQFVKLYEYYIDPMDYEYCILSVDEYKQIITARFAEKYKYCSNFKRVDLEHTLDEIDEIVSRAQTSFNVLFGNKPGGEALRCQPMVFPLPVEVDGMYSKTTFAVILKRDEDGDTMVYSPVPLEYLCANAN